MAKSQAQKFKEAQVKLLPTSIGIYALCDLDEVPVYVGQSIDGIRDRVRRHLTSARSDVIANRQIDVWEMAYVWAWPMPNRQHMKLLECHLFSLFNATSPLANGKVLNDPGVLPFAVPQKVRVQVMPDDLIVARQDPTLRFPRQIQHFNQLVDYILNTQDKRHLRRALQVYYDRLTRYLMTFLNPVAVQPPANPGLPAPPTRAGKRGRRQAPPRP